jgi:hypothetical protein
MGKLVWTSGVSRGLSTRCLSRCLGPEVWSVASLRCSADLTPPMHRPEAFVSAELLDQRAGEAQLEPVNALVVGLDPRRGRLQATASGNLDQPVCCARSPPQSRRCRAGSPARCAWTAQPLECLLTCSNARAVCRMDLGSVSAWASRARTWPSSLRASRAMARRASSRRSRCRRRDLVNGLSSRPADEDFRVGPAPPRPPLRAASRRPSWIWQRRVMVWP